MEFVIDWGPYQFMHMLFGAINAPMMFQRAIEVVFAPCIRKYFCIYLDDGAIYDTMDKHIGHLEQILETC